MNDAPSPPSPHDEDSMRTMRPGAEPELGRIDQYAVLRRLGGGGYGVVYLARDTVSGVLFALKTLHPLVKRNPEELERVRRSFALVSGLAHDGIAGARVLHEVRAAAFSDETARRELLLSPGDFVMVLTYAPGVTLSAWTRQFPNGVAPLARALEVGAQVAAALDYAHGKGVVHRDVKPGNVMVETLAAGPQGVEGLNVESQKSEDGTGSWTLDLGPSTRIRVRILDFGLAAEIRSSLSRVSNEKGDVSGTRPYMAPEQWRGKKQDGRTDQYALACMLYELLSGDPPFAGAFETGDEAIMRSVVLNEAPDPVEGLSPAANAALLRALSKDPKERFPTCGAFVAALEGRDGSTSRPPDGRAVGASLPENTGGASPSGEPQREAGMSGRALPPGAPQRSEEAARSASALRQATPSVEDETALLDRKVVLAEALAAIPDADRADKEFAPFVQEATRAFRAAEEALKFGRIPAFASCLDRTDAALESLRRAKAQRKADAERKARVEEEQRRMEQEREAEEERKRREEAARIAREAEERRRQQQAREAALALEDAERQRTAEAEERGKLIRLTWCVIVGFVVVFFVIATVLARMDSSSADTAGENSTSSAIPIAAESSNPEAGAVRTVTVGNVAFTLNWCPPGSFTMGSPVGEDGRYGDEARHRVELTKGFWMGETEVTQGLWKEVMGANPSSFQSGDDYPVENVSWYNCQDFLRKLNAKAPQGWWFALPTEAQWEYACRAGSSGPFSGTGRLDDMGWHDSNSDGKTHPVAQKKANAWGLFDMHGNVWEWCADGYGSYPSGTVTNPFGSASGSSRVSRGGSWFSPDCRCRSALRNRHDPKYNSGGLGLRVALIPVP